MDSKQSASTIQDSAVNQLELARRSMLSRSIKSALVWVAILIARLELGGTGAVRAVLTTLVYAVGIYALTILILEFFVRPRKINYAGKPSVTFVGLMPAETLVALGQIHEAVSNTTISGKLIFDMHRVTWIPGNLYRAGLEPIEMPLEKGSANVRKVRNLTPLGYLEISRPNKPVIGIRIFQPKAIQELVNKLS